MSRFSLAKAVLDEGGNFPAQIVRRIKASVRLWNERRYVDAVLLREPSMSMFFLANKKNILSATQMATVLASADFSDKLNKAYLHTFLSSNDYVPNEFLAEHANKNKSRAVLEVISAHPSASDETRVLASLRLQALSR